MNPLLARALDFERQRPLNIMRFASFKRRVKKLERKLGQVLINLKELYKLGLQLGLESTVEEESLGGVCCGQEVAANEKDDEGEITLAQALLEMNSTKPKEHSKRVNTCEDFRTKLVEGKENRGGTELIQETTKKQKVEDDKETTELKQCLEIILDEEEVTIDAIPLAVKSLSIVDWKIYKEGRKSYYQIMRADGKSQMYMFFSKMLKSFDRGDLEDLYKLVKAKYKSTKPVEDLDLLLCGNLKTMFEPHVKSSIEESTRIQSVGMEAV
ncbi:hypothetical protein Tco_1018138 [Tanacetum coccineum]|uniref:Uncharacterized protein n=1 Tax=Tanacetum coccineum TaxID=301880 RepID=A0ABQ5FTG3_9ASTR